MAPVICLITPPAGTTRAEVDRIRTAAHAGVHLVQIRKRDAEARDLVLLVEEAVQAVRGTSARVLVNDRFDVALAGDAHGVHLRGDAPAASRVRAVAPPGFVIGRSVHSVEDARQAARDGGVDYLLFGTVFPSSSKQGAAAAGPEALAAVCEAVCVPVLAVGGVRLPRLGLVGAAGAAGFAAIGLFADPPLEALASIVIEAGRVFSAPGPPP